MSWTGGEGAGDMTNVMSISFQNRLPAEPISQPSCQMLNCKTFNFIGASPGKLLVSSHRKPQESPEFKCSINVAVVPHGFKIFSNLQGFSDFMGVQRFAKMLMFVDCSRSFPDFHVVP